jgi:hypothetical protein
MHNLKSHKTVEQIAKKHRLEVSFIQKQLDMGEPIEHEHTKDHELAMDIALQHLDEIPDYYTRLKKMEASAKKEHKKFKDIKENEYDISNIDDMDTPIHMHYKHGIHIDYEKRYCPKCKRVEMRKECKYGPRYWDIFSMPEKLKEGNLHQWFKGSKSKEGKPGWVNVVTGGTCASDEPGEGTPKCVSSTKRASMTKAERLSASRRKKAADPGQQQKTGAAKPTYVSTDTPKKKMKEAKDHEYSMARSELSTIMSAAKRLKSKMGKGEGEIEAWVQSKITKAADYLDTAADYVDSGEMNEEKDIKGKGSGKKDACYSKVKARYDVWPSAYASGALAKCRKKGAANWGNKSEQYSGIVAEIINELEEACWKGYAAKGMKKKGNKMVPNCVPVKEETKCPKCSGKTCKCETPEPDEYNDRQKKEIGEAVRLPATNGNIISVVLSWRGRSYMTKMFFPQVKMPSRSEITDQIQKVYPGATILQYNLAGLEPGQPLIQVSDKSKNYLLNNKTIGEETEVSEVVYESGDYWHPDPKKDSAISGVGNKMRAREDQGKDTSAQTKPDYSKRLKPGETYMQFAQRREAERRVKEELEIQEVAAWQRKEGKNPEGGLNKAGIASYRREHPGSKLSLAVTTKPSKLKKGSKAANRRKSFCARMSGMKKRLTSAKTANDPNSRINKSLRKWNC